MVRERPRGRGKGSTCARCAVRGSASPEGSTLQKSTPQPRLGVTARPPRAGKWVQPWPGGRLFRYTKSVTSR